FADPVEDPRGDLVRALPADVAGPAAGFDQPAAGDVEEHRLVEARVGDEAARAAGDDAELDPGPPRGLDAHHRDRERMAGPADDDPVEQEVVDARPVERGGLQARGDDLGAPGELLDRRIVVAATQRAGEAVERT